MSYHGVVICNLKGKSVKIRRGPATVMGSVKQ